jgi:hypothetical protein
MYMYTYTECIHTLAQVWAHNLVKEVSTPYHQTTQVLLNMIGQSLTLTCSIRNLLEIPTLICIFFMKLYFNEKKKCTILKIIQRSIQKYYYNF